MGKPWLTSASIASVCMDLAVSLAITGAVSTFECKCKDIASGLA